MKFWEGIIIGAVVACLISGYIGYKMGEKEVLFWAGYYNCGEYVFDSYTGTAKWKWEKKPLKYDNSNEN